MGKAGMLRTVRPPEEVRFCEGASEAFRPQGGLVRFVLTSDGCGISADRLGSYVGRTQSWRARGEEIQARTSSLGHLVSSSSVASLVALFC